MSSTPKKDESTEGSSESPSKKSAEKDDAVTQLGKAFRTYSSSMVMATKQAKKMAELAPGEGKAKSKDKKGAADRKQAEGQLKLAAEALVKYRQQVRHTVTVLEGKIRGNAKESEALECSLRSQPCIGGRARKRKFACDE